MRFSVVWNHPIAVFRTVKHRRRTTKNKASAKSCLRTIKIQDISSSTQKSFTNPDSRAAAISDTQTCRKCCGQVGLRYLRSQPTTTADSRSFAYIPALWQYANISGKIFTISEPVWSILRCATCSCFAALPF